MFIRRNQAETQLDRFSLIFLCIKFFDSTLRWIIQWHFLIHKDATLKQKRVSRYFYTSQRGENVFSVCGRQRMEISFGFHNKGVELSNLMDFHCFTVSLHLIIRKWNLDEEIFIFKVNI